MNILVQSWCYETFGTCCPINQNNFLFFSRRHPVIYKCFIFRLLVVRYVTKIRNRDVNLSLKQNGNLNYRHKKLTCSSFDILYILYVLYIRVCKIICFHTTLFLSLSLSLSHLYYTHYIRYT